MCAYWERVLEAEDRAEEVITRAHDEEKEIVNGRRQEATAMVEEMKRDYGARLTGAKTESEQRVRRLQDDLQSDQQEGKAKSAAMVANKKDEIVKILLNAVLSVELE